MKGTAKMADRWYIVKNGKFLTSASKFTDNLNLAHLYDDEEIAAYFAKPIGGEVKILKHRDWVVVKDGEYLGRGGKLVEDLKAAYSFSSKSVADRYARDFNGEAVQVMARMNR
ncbi:MAG: hypothetical protein GX133_03880 [Syntrophomonadaceae bacterium]|nr:hypothetical protein [Syntrophomonadaceae bacterium]